MQKLKQNKKKHFCFTN